MIEETLHFKKNVRRNNGQILPKVGFKKDINVQIQAQQNPNRINISTNPHTHTS